MQEKADDDDFKRHQISIGLYNTSSTDCAAEVRATEDEVRSFYPGAVRTFPDSDPCFLSDILTTAISYSYRFTALLGLEAGYILGPETDVDVLFTRDPDPATRRSLSYEKVVARTTFYTAATVDYFRRWPFAAYAIAGLANWSVDGHSGYTSDMLPHGPSFSDGGTAPIVGVGLAVRSGSGLLVRLSYKEVFTSSAGGWGYLAEGWGYLGFEIGFSF